MHCVCVVLRIAWAHSFDTYNNGVTTVDVTFASFVPTKFANVVTPRPVLKTSMVTALQLTYSKFEYEGKLNPNFSAGPFALAIESIGAY